MNKITDYLTIHQFSLEKLDEAVKFAIKEGWQPFGGIGISAEPTYIQIVVKYAEATDYDHSQPQD